MARRCLLVLLLACSSKSEPKQRNEPPAPQPRNDPPAPWPVRSACPRGASDTDPWTHEVFAGCAPPQFHGLDASCKGACPRPCRMVVEAYGKTRTRTLEYDAQGRYVTTREDGTQPRACEYDEAGRMRACGDAKIERDANHRIVRVADDTKGELAAFAYDARGFVVSISTEMVGTTIPRYSDLGQLVSEKVPGEELVYHYDRSGRVTHYDAVGHKPDRWTYDELGRLVTTAYAETQESYAYDASDRFERYERTEGGQVRERVTVSYCD